MSSAMQFIDLDTKVSPAILASIFGCNVSLIYQDVQSGKLPNPIIDHTYRECIQFSRKYMLKNVEVKLEKEANEQRLKEAKLIEDTKFRESKLRAKEKTEQDSRERKNDSGFEGDDGMPPLLAAKVKQEIRLGIAREQQLWIKASIDRADYLSQEELLELCEPLMLAIRQSLISVSLESEEAEKQIDLLMENLYKLGTTMVDHSNIDSDNFISAIMKKEIDFTELDLNSVVEPVL